MYQGHSGPDRSPLVPGSEAWVISMLGNIPHTATGLILANLPSFPSKNGTNRVLHRQVCLMISFELCQFQIIMYKFNFKMTNGVSVLKPQNLPERTSYRPLVLVDSQNHACTGLPNLCDFICKYFSHCLHLFS